MAANDYVVETHDLSKRFGELTAVDQVDLRVPRGSAFGYLGPNGAGKTTLIRMLLGLIRPSAGEINLLGLPLPRQRQRALARIGAIVEEPRFHPHLTGRHNLWAIAAAREPAAHHRIGPALERVCLAGRGDDRVGSYSLGMRQRLGVAACLLADPELLILDEPMNGLDPAGMLEFRSMIRDFVEEGRTVVLSSHLLDEVEKTCDAVAIVDHGRVVVQGSIAELSSQGERRLLVATGDDQQARALLLAQATVDAVHSGNGALVLELDHGRPVEQAAAAIAEQLVANGIPLYRLEPEQQTLEQRFLQVTSRLGEEKKQ
ncbi:MAG: ABC transporter ATP-binding protein [Gaiellaceae bacterium]